MRAIEYNTEIEAIQAWEELESLCEHLHQQGTEKYTYLIGNVLILEPHHIYNEVVNEWIENKELIDYNYEAVNDGMNADEMSKFIKENYPEQDESDN